MKHSTGTYTARRLGATSWRALCAGLLGVLLSACGGGDTGASTRSANMTSRVEAYTPAVADAGDTGQLKALRADAPAPSHQIVLPALTTALPRAATNSPRIGVPEQVGLGRDLPGQGTDTDLTSALRWTTSSTGSQLAAVRVVSGGAVGTRLMLQVTRLSPRTLLRFYGGNASAALEVKGTDVLDTVYANLAEKPGDPASRLYVAPYVEGEEVTLEIELPADVPTSSFAVHLPRVSHLYQSPTSLAPQLRIGNSASCEVDVACDSGWINVGNGVARMLFSDGADGGSYLCSGTLLNDRINSGMPYFLTARHCISTQAAASTLQTFWFYRANACGSNVLNANTKTLPGGARLLYTTPTTDSTFLQLVGMPPAGATFQGWSTDTVLTGTDVGGVHHPAGDVQKRSLGKITGYGICNLIAGFTSYSCSSSTNAADPQSAYLNVNFTSGITEGGSSGSGLFVTSNGSRYLVGTLTGGSSSCDAGSSKANDNYGRFDRVYKAALYQWLDAGVGNKEGLAGVRTPIYRFYNATTDAHFFTASQWERDYVSATFPQFKYEGEGFYAYTVAAPGLQSVYRFFNTATSSHFYTISADERDYVIQHYPQYRYEGNAWYALAAGDGSTLPLFRFYNTRRGTHFYTVSAPERDFVIQNYPQYQNEGVAYYVWSSN